jgi:hypothetical protein
MNTKPSRRFFMILPLTIWLAACVGVQTFTPIARQGDTVAVTVGWKKNLARQNITVTITDNSGAAVTYPPNDSRVRGILNVYPDPASRAVVGTMTNQDLGYAATVTGGLINENVTINNATYEHDNDWWQTVLFLDLPSTMATGTATISIAGGGNIKPASVTIVPGTGSSNLFNIHQFGSTFEILSPMYFPNALKSLERAGRYTVTFGSYTDASGYWIVPHSIELQFTHTPSVGASWVVNPRGDIKNVVWSDDGTNIKVMLTPTQGVTLTQILDFKFYIAGDITGLTLVPSSMKAYDVNGNLMSGITVSTTFND